VCKKFFLQILGKKVNKLNGKKEITYKELITNFIDTKNPHFSHYNRENIPNRRYIDNTNCVELYLEFAKKNNFTPAFKTSENENNKNCIYKYYYIIVKSHLNISFTNPCNDLCKTCFKWKNHQKLLKENNCGENFNQCISYKIHTNEVKTVRQQYRRDILYKF
jgi:hypothetical protein